MSLEDPFFVVRDEVRQSLTSAQQQYSQWAMLLDSDVDPEKVQSIGSELKNLIKSIEWDLEDLDQTIKIAEANPAKFRLNYGELETRKQFIRDTRSVVKVCFNELVKLCYISFDVCVCVGAFCTVVVNGRL